MVVDTERGQLVLSPDAKGGLCCKPKKSEPMNLHKCAAELTCQLASCDFNAHPLVPVYCALSFRTPCSPNSFVATAYGDACH